MIAASSSKGIRIVTNEERDIMHGRTTMGTRNRMGRALVLAFVSLIVALALAPVAQADLQFEHVGFGVDEAPDPNNLNPDGTFVPPPFNRQAGAHSDLTVAFSLPGNPANGGSPFENPRDIDVDLPLGFVGNPSTVTACPPSELGRTGGFARCRTSAQVGVAEVITSAAAVTNRQVPLYSIEHGANVPARFGFNAFGVIGLITARVRPGDYGISSGSFSITQAEAVKAVRIHLWGVPADPIHDRMRQIDGGSLFVGGPLGGPTGEFGAVSTDAPLKPFLSNPTSCTDEPVSFTMRGRAWTSPDAVDTEVRDADENGVPFKFTGCNRLPFDPSADLTPTSSAAGSSTGLNVDIHVPQPQDPDGLAEAHVKRVSVQFPKGMTVNPSSAAGLDGCSPPEIGLGNNDTPTCPDSSKLGTVKIETPLLQETLEGSVFLAKPNDNPFNSLLALYIAVKGPGFYLKLPGRVETDPITGQLTTIFDDNPQLPFEDLHLELKGGPRAALTAPNSCGTYDVKSELTSWASDTPVVESTPIVIDQNCNAGGFDPRLSAGTIDAGAGSFSPFLLRVTRNDGEANLSRLEATLPEGLLAKLAGVPLCGDAQATTGDCPAGSKVGSVVVGSGSGPLPLYVPEAGKAPTAAYLGGPYHGAPYSLVVKVPAQAGPFDLGTVTIRNALQIDPITTQVTAKSDPLPQILQGIPIAYRDVRVEMNRPDFTINPTSCKSMKVASVLTAATGQTASPSSPFQATGCRELGFKPKLALKLSGAPTHRGGHPALKAVLTMPKGGANIGSAQVTLPKTEFLENAHIRTICTRVQFAAEQCPKGSIYGYAKAWSPLLDTPLQGPVYLRSSNHTLPDLVASLDGKIHVDLDGRISSANKRLRNTFDFVPDAPVSKFVLQMQGGQKSLLVNNEELCKAKGRAEADFIGQNGKRSLSHPVVKVAGCGGKKK